MTTSTTIQSSFDALSFNEQGQPSIVDERPPPPDDSELKHLIAPTELYDFPVNEVQGIDALRQDIRDAVYANDHVHEWSMILKDHISQGNKKLASNIGIFNIGSAHDCVNIGTEYCQVAANECYAAKNERDFPHPLDARRRQIIIWDHLDAATFSRAFREMHSRKRTPLDVLRINESGDLRHRHDLFKLDEISRRLSDIVTVYTYSASSWLPWHETNHFTINRSNDRREYGHRRFEVVDDANDIPEHGIRCPHDYTDGEIQCGDCLLCIEQDAGNVYVEKF